MKLDGANFENCTEERFLIPMVICYHEAGNRFPSFYDFESIMPIIETFLSNVDVNLLHRSSQVAS